MGWSMGTMCLRVTGFPVFGHSRIRIRFMQGKGERGSAAEILAEVLCRTLQKLQHSQSVAEELIQALEQARMHAKESQGRHQQAMRYMHTLNTLSKHCSRTTSPSTVTFHSGIVLETAGLSIAAAHVRPGPSIGVSGDAGVSGIGSWKTSRGGLSRGFRQRRAELRNSRRLPLMLRVLRGSTRAACQCWASSWRMCSMLSGILQACSGPMTSSMQEWPVIEPERLITCQCSASSWRMHSRLGSTRWHIMWPAEAMQRTMKRPLTEH